MAVDEEEDSSHNQGAAGSRTIQRLVQFGLAALLIASNIGQRVTFKSLGYLLGPYPFFMLAVISGTFPVVFGVICIGITLTSGGFLRGTRTWRNLCVFWVMGICNALQGICMVFANPHVAGYMQALLQQSMVPFTLVGSVLILRARFSWVQYCGVVLIMGGVFLQLLNGGKHHDSGAGSSLSWELLYVLAQLPVALASILQENSFKLVPVNVFLMMFWASTAQFVTLLVLAPLDCIPHFGDASSVAEFFKNFGVAWHLVVDGAATSAMIGCIASLLLSQFSQMLMVKHSSAAFAVLCMAFVVPGAAIVFTQPFIMGPNAEQLTGTAPIALGLVFFGIVGFKLGERKRSMRAAIGHRRSSDPGSPRAPPLVSAGFGIVASEYGGSRWRRLKLSFFQELTACDVEAAEQLSEANSPSFIVAETSLSTVTS